MPQYARKSRQMINVTGIHPPVYAERLYTVAGSVQTLVGKTQFISKASGGTWPGADWIITLGPGHASVQSEIVSEEKEKREPEIPHVQYPPSNKPIF